MLVVGKLQSVIDLQANHTLVVIEAESIKCPTTSLMHHELSVGRNNNNASGKSCDFWTILSTASSISDATSDNSVSWVFIGIAFLETTSCAPQIT